MEGHRCPADSEHGGIAPTISTSPPAPAISILCLLLLFSVKRAPTGETVASARGHGPDTDYYSTTRVEHTSSPFRELMGWGFAVLSNSGTFWEGGDPIVSRSREMIYSQLARTLLNSHFKLAAISSCVRHLDASMNQIYIRRSVRIVPPVNAISFAII